MFAGDLRVNFPILIFEVFDLRFYFPILKFEVFKFYSHLIMIKASKCLFNINGYFKHFHFIICPKF